ncbi:NAD(P)H-binding protein [Nocardioides sp.]|uniref:NAD(P)H-binding protein n=1 Tax=Nocardioides sp. TaxID=35761 RepID=UPI00286DBC87|nr:NAD(P)H-binding protein [Nocardioides sp.]
MRILVLGATGYVGSRLIPALLDEGHVVVAASSSDPSPSRFDWGSSVDWMRCDVTSTADVEAALVDVDAVCYLVHSLSRRGFSGPDLLGAEVVRRGVDAASVTRLVYLSGLVPDVPRDELSPHIASRLEVEEELLRSSASTVALRAGVIIGAGSTSFEVIRQLASLLVVQPVPWWLRSRIQPIAVTDAVRALVEAFAPDSALSGTVDIGGPDVLRYPRLLAAYSRAARLLRVRIPVLLAPAPLVAAGTASLVQAPFWTVTALVASLRHDMVCRPEATWTPASGEPLTTVRAAMQRAVAGVGLEGPLPSDPDWTRQRAPLFDRLPAPRSVRAGASLAWHRLRSL